MFAEIDSDVSYFSDDLYIIYIMTVHRQYLLYLQP